MLEYFVIMMRGGLVLWSFNLPDSEVDLLKNVIRDRVTDPGLSCAVEAGKEISWTFCSNPPLIFLVVRV